MKQQLNFWRKNSYRFYNSSNLEKRIVGKIFYQCKFEWWKTISAKSWHLEASIKRIKTLKKALVKKFVFNRLSSHFQRLLFSKQSTILWQFPKTHSYFLQDFSRSCNLSEIPYSKICSVLVIKKVTNQCRTPT